MGKDIWRRRRRINKSVWYEIDEINRINNEIIDFNLSDLEIQYSD